MTTAIETPIATLPQRAAMALKSTEQESALRALVLSSADIVAVTNKDGREQAHRIGITLKNARVTIEKVSKAAREDATAFSKAVIAEEKRLVDIVAGEETRVFGLRDGYDAIEAKRVADAIAAERARTDLIKEHIEDLRRIPLALAGKSAALIQIELDDTRAIVIAEDRFGEQPYREQAEAVRGASVAQLEAMLAEAVEREAEAARLLAEREAEDKRRADEAAELARQRAEQQRVAAEQAAAQKALDDAAAAQRDALRIEAEQAAAARKAEDDERARIAAEAAAILAAEQAAFAAERQAFADQQAAVAKAEQAKAEQDARDRLAAETPAPPQSEMLASAPVEAASTLPALSAEDAAFDAQHGGRDLAPAEQAAVEAEGAANFARAHTPPSLRLGQISERLGFNVTAAFLGTLGFEPAGRDKSAVLFHEHDFKAICAAILRHVSAVQAKF